MNQVEDWIVNNRAKLMKNAYQFVKDKESAEDLVQDSILKMLKNVDKFDGENIGGWSFMILKNTFISKYHKDKKNGETSLFSNSSDARNDGDSDGRADYLYKFSYYNEGEAKIVLEDIMFALDKIENHFIRKVLELRFKGFQFWEIADYLDRPNISCRGAYFRGIKEMREILKENL